MRMTECTRELGLWWTPVVNCRTARMSPMMMQAKPSETSTNIDHLRAAVDSRQLVTDSPQHDSFHHARTPTHLSLIHI